MKNNIKVQKLEQTIIKETSEGITKEVKSVTTERVQEPDYVKLYLQDMLMLTGLTTKLTDLLFKLLSMVDYKLRIVLNAHIRREIAGELGIKYDTLEKYLRKLSSKKIILKKATNLYIVNPRLFGRGKWQNIKELRLKINYSENGKEVSTDIVKHEVE